jgi:predicted AAA+ superfamily ATPase
MFERILKINLENKKSGFLWGPRKTGKTSFLRQIFPESTSYDFLKTDIYFKILKEPSVLRQELSAMESSGRLKQPIILDEVQKVPTLLDEIHWMIENKVWQFVLCGSSPRKLKRGHANLLGGRAWRFEMFPLVSREIPDFNLLDALNRGLIPSHYTDRNYRRSLKAYIQDYLKEEIMAEGLVRNLPAFARFMDSIGYSHGEMINFSNISRDCGIDAKTVKAYYEILVDTLLGVFLDPFSKKSGRQIISSTPKFYLFDVGVAGFLGKREIKEERGEQFGRAFEHFILMELLAYRSYSEKDFRITYWRTKSGIEVDFVLGDGQVAIEVKSGRNIDASATMPLRVFNEEYGSEKSIMVTNEQSERLVDFISMKPWCVFLNELWDGKII